MSYNLTTQNEITVLSFIRGTPNDKIKLHFQNSPNWEFCEFLTLEVLLFIDISQANILHLQLRIRSSPPVKMHEYLEGNSKLEV